MEFQIVPAHDLSLAEQAAVANEAFAGYVGGWTDLDAATLARFLCLQGADLYYSRFVRSAGRLLGFGYINRTATILRLTGMAIVADARGTGAADALFLHLLDEARARLDEAMMLEVIEQNPRALAFYRRHGFREIMRLSGWRRTADAGSITRDAVEIEEVSILSALHAPSANDYPDLPWQITRHAIAKVAGARAFRRGNAAVVIGDPNVATIRIHGLLSATADASEREERRALLAAVLQSFPDREFFAPAIFPDIDGVEIFQPLGFTREPLSQLLMRRDFRC